MGDSTAQRLELGAADVLALYDDLLIPVLAVDADRQILYFNQQCLGFLKLPPRKLRGKPIDQVVACEVIRSGRLIDATFEEWVPKVSEETTIDVGDGELRDAIFKTIPVTFPDGTHVVVVTIQDISIERILHAKHRLQLDELKRKNEEIRKYSEGLEILVEERTRELRIAKEESERLLLNILPEKIAERLKRGSESIIADRFEACSVMFVDIVSFTTIASGLDPVEVVRFLSRTFDVFDDLVARHGLEKIKTIGDAYLVVAGVPESRKSHALEICSLALEMQDAMNTINAGLDHGLKLKARFGISSGSLVAGVIGKSKFAYDIWGDTVNVAARMESHGIPGRIQISESTYELIKDSFQVEARGAIEIKGKGAMNAFWLIGRK